MRSRDPLERLAAAGRPLHAQADALVGAEEENRILAGILASDRRPAPRAHRRRRAALVLVGVAVLAAAGVVASLEVGGGGGSSSPTGRTGHHRVVLSGARIELAGYHFRTPAGFAARNGACPGVDFAGNGSSIGPSGSGTNGFAAAASADGGCLGAFFVAGGYVKIPDGARPVDVGKYQGYLVAPDSSGARALYVRLPQMGEYSPYLALFARGLTSEQLIAVAQSGLPANPGPGITTTCTANCG
jgi:hypothetical protein